MSSLLFIRKVIALKLQKRWKGILSIVIVVTGVLIGGLLLYVRSHQNQIIKDEIALLNEAYKGRITVGNSELSIWGNFPYLSIKVYDIKIFETKADDAPLIMEVEDIYVGFNLWDMVSGNYDVQS